MLTYTRTIICISLNTAVTLVNLIVYSQQHVGLYTTVKVFHLILNFVYWDIEYKFDWWFDDWGIIWQSLPEIIYYTY
jgi:hypothetical protein